MQVAVVEEQQADAPRGNHEACGVINRLGNLQPFFSQGPAFDERAQFGIARGEEGTGCHGGQEGTTGAFTAPRTLPECDGLSEAVNRQPIVALGHVCLADRVQSFFAALALGGLLEHLERLAEATGDRSLEEFLLRPEQAEQIGLRDAGALGDVLCRRSFEAAIRGLEPDWTLPDLELPGRPERPPPQQAEFVQTPASYLRETPIAKLAEQGRALLQGYARGRGLSDAERAVFPLLCRGAAMRFLLTRLVDWLEVPPGALVRPKDPFEYYRKLRFHQAVKSVRDYGIEG